MADDTSGADAGADTSADAALDADAPLAVTLQFEATVSGVPAACGTSYSDLGSTGATAQLADARVFLSGIELGTADGSWVDVRVDDSTWQNDGVALLDFEDGTAACADSGTAELNDVVTGAVPAGVYTRLRFDVGIPFAQNHLDSATAPSPLNQPGMFWAWQGGYKFVRVDWAVDGGAVPRWNTHIGSTGCVSDAPTVAPAEECGRPNMATVELDGFDPATSTIVVDLGALVAGVDLKTSVVDSPPGCMSSPAEAADCGGVASALGMSFDSGACADGCAGQTVFSVAD
ncbi:MAG: metallo-mystery pair system four-Cys motif protein [Myxococcales bacterium]|nr:metallo-mystery pair system four-Cys motif protein [Myxococcales bacterium]